jgi:hypothetical protein
MRYMVIFRVREAIVGERVPAVQQAIGAEVQKLLGTGKVSDSGVFVDDRAGFVLLDAASAEELFELIAGLHDVAKVEAHPLISFERLGQFFQEQAAGRAR